MVLLQAHSSLQPGKASMAVGTNGSMLSATASEVRKLLPAGSAGESEAAEAVSGLPFAEEHIFFKPPPSHQTEEIKYFFFSHHKCGTELSRHLVREMADVLGLDWSWIS